MEQVFFTVGGFVLGWMIAATKFGGSWGTVLAALAAGTVGFTLCP